MQTDPWVARQRAAVAQTGWPAEQLAAALRVPPARVLDRIRAGEIRAAQFGTVTVVSFEQLAPIGLI